MAEGDLALFVVYSQDTQTGRKYWQKFPSQKDNKITVKETNPDIVLLTRPKTACDMSGFALSAVVVPDVL